MRYFKLFRKIFSKAVKKLTINQWKTLHIMMDEPILKYIARDFFSNPYEEVLTVFDVGANIGNFTKQLYNDFPSAKIYSFEPSKATYETFVSNFQGVERVIPVNIALSDEDKEGCLFNSRFSCCSSLNPHPLADNGISEFVKINKIDSFCIENKIDRINVLKIDAEGHDFQVIKGCSENLKNHKIDILYFECSFIPEDKYHANFYEVAAFLSKYRYILAGFTETSMLNNEECSLFFCNAIFVRKK